MTWRPWLVLGVFCLWVLYTFGPILGMLLSTFLGERLGCAVNEGGSAPCLLFGVDIGGLLAGTSSAGRASDAIGSRRTPDRTRRGGTMAAPAPDNTGALRVKRPRRPCPHSNPTHSGGRING